MKNPQTPKATSKSYLSTPPSTGRNQFAGSSSQNEPASPTVHKSRKNDPNVLEILNSSKLIFEFQQKESEGLIDADQLEQVVKFLQSDKELALEYLKAFDLDSKYGPCIGLSRMDRFTRAKNLNLKPPNSVAILLTHYLQESDSTILENLWHNIL